MQVAKWGNSLAVRLPKRLVERFDLKEGDELDVRMSEPGFLELSVEERRRIALEVLKTFEGALPADYKFDRDEANER